MTYSLQYYSPYVTYGGIFVWGSSLCEIAKGVHLRETLMHGPNHWRKSVKTGMIHRQSACRMEGNGEEFEDGKDVSLTIENVFSGKDVIPMELLDERHQGRR